MQGRYARLEPLSVAHVPDLHRANGASDAIWDYLPYGPFAREDDYRAWVADMAAKVDATALDAADSAHADNKGYHVGQGLYRIDWPDAAFDGGVGKVVNLAVVCSGVDTTFLEVELVGVAQTGDSYARLGAPAGASVSADIAALNDLSAADVNAEVVDVLRTDTIPDAYSADGDQPTFAQAVLAILQFLTEKAVSGTTVTVKKPNGSTTAMTFTLDDGTNPTSITRAS